MTIDTSAEVHERDAEGWERGLYADVQRTFRAPVVNWIFRTLVANEPAATRYLWGQVKPLFQTRACAVAVDAHREAVRSRVDPPHLGRERLGLAPAEFRELQGQLATFDAVVPRLSLLFAAADLGLQGESLAADEEVAPAATRPHGRSGIPPARRAPTMASVGDSEAAVPAVVADVRSFHGFDDELPSVYRCLAQWPDAFRETWDAVAPDLRSDDFEAATDRCGDVAATAVREAAYTPRLAPADFERLGLDGADIEGLQALFATFNRGPVASVLPAVHVLAAALDAESPTRE
jgi:hypothetical protein